MAGTRRLSKFEGARSIPSERGGVTGDPAMLKTRLARRFTTLADTINERFVDFHIGAGNWGLELTSPEGMSTGAGKQAVQHLRMRPRRAGYPMLVAGMVNSIEGTAELRDYAHISSIHSRRFGRPIEIVEAEWEQLLRRCEVALKTANIAVVRTPPEPSSAAESPSARRFSVPVAVGVALATLVTLASFVFVR